MRFNFFIGGYFGGHFELSLNKTNLVCFISNVPYKPIKPTHILSIQDDDDWEIFVQYVQTLKWKEVYDNRILDGTQWTLEFIPNNFLFYYSCRSNKAAHQKL